MIYILILLIGGKNGIAVDHIEFSSKESCQQLQKELSEKLPEPHGYFKCIKK